MKCHFSVKMVKNKTLFATLIVEVLFNVYMSLYGANSLADFRISKYHTCLSSKSVLYKIVGISVQHCIDECASLSNCSAINYKHHYKLCEIHSISHESLDVHSDGACLYVERSDILVTEVSAGCTNCTDESCDIARCRTKFCPALEMTYGVLHGNMRVVGSRVEIECPKYLREISDEKYTICQANGSWTVYPKCSGHLYLGCYEDRRERILFESTFGSTSLTTEMCVTRCLHLNFLYALTEFSSQCYCGNILKDYPKKPEQECNMPCSGNSSQICGGVWRSSVYKNV